MHTQDTVKTGCLWRGNHASEGHGGREICISLHSLLNLTPCARITYFRFYKPNSSIIAITGFPRVPSGALLATPRPDLSLWACPHYLPRSSSSSGIPNSSLPSLQWFREDLRSQIPENHWRGEEIPFIKRKKENRGCVSFVSRTDHKG